MAEGTPDEISELDQRVKESRAFMQKVLALADAENVEPGALVGGCIQAAAVILATEWLADVGSMKEAWKDAMKGFGLNMLLWAWSQRPDVGPGGQTSTQKH